MVLAWIPVTLWSDQFASLGQQRLLGLGTWALLLWLLRDESFPVRLQTAVVVVFATAVEYTFSPWLEVYTYRLDNVPAFVPPGHGLVYLAALCLGRTDFFRGHARGLVTLTVVLGGLYAAWGVSPWAPRPDVLGLFWYLCLLGFLTWGRSRLLYVGCLPGGDVPRADRHVDRHLGLAAIRPDGAGEHGQPPERRRRRLRLVRPGGDHARTRAGAVVVTRSRTPPKCSSSPRCSRPLDETRVASDHR